MRFEPELLGLDAVPIASPALTALNEGLVQAAANTFSPELPSLKAAVDACQRQTVRVALERTGHNWAEAARMLNVDASNLHKLARRLGIK